MTYTIAVLRKDKVIFRLTQHANGDGGFSWFADGSEGLEPYKDVRMALAQAIEFWDELERRQREVAHGA